MLRLIRSSRWRGAGALVAAVGMGVGTAVLVPAQTATARPASSALAGATAWGLDSVAVSGGTAFLVGYATAPSPHPWPCVGTGPH